MHRAFFSLGVIVRDSERMRLRILQFIKDLSILVSAFRKQIVLLRRDRSSHLPHACADRTERYESETNFANFANTERLVDACHGLSAPFPAGAHTRGRVLPFGLPPPPRFFKDNFQTSSGCDINSVGDPPGTFSIPAR